MKCLKQIKSDITTHMCAPFYEVYYQYHGCGAVCTFVVSLYLFLKHTLFCFNSLNSFADVVFLNTRPRRLLRSVRSGRFASSARRKVSYQSCHQYRIYTANVNYTVSDFKVVTFKFGTGMHYVEQAGMF